MVQPALMSDDAEYADATGRVGSVQGSDGASEGQSQEAGL